MGEGGGGGGGGGRYREPGWEEWWEGAVLRPEGRIHGEASSLSVIRRIGEISFGLKLAHRTCSM